MSSLKIKLKDFESLDITSEEEYELDYSIKIATKILQSYSTEHELNDCAFENSTWYLFDKIAGSRRKIDFKEYERFISDNMVLSAIKCWLANQIDRELSPVHVSKNAGYLFRIIEKSNCFDPAYIENTLTILDHGGLSDRTSFTLSQTALNFLDYFQEIDSSGLYTERLWKIKMKQFKKGGIRILPSSHDILNFSMIIDSYFNESMSTDEYLRYFPIYIWWKLTNLIPMRISDFCSIERNCLFKKQGNYYIKLPRNKQNKRSIQVIDQIYISQNIAKSIMEYIEKTNDFGVSTTLISYKSIPKHAKYHQMKIDSSVFTKRDMQYRLNQFYENIVFKKYGYTHYENSLTAVTNINNFSSSKVVNRKIRPNDTRHFAFLNLMTQGYHPVEIARLGGHNSLHSQYHYHQHVEYWVDSEVMELMLNFNLKENINYHTDDFFSDKEFKEQFILRPPSHPATHIELYLGYCTDPNQFCAVDECIDCEHWRISFNEYKEKSHIIKAKTMKKENEIRKLINSLKKLHSTGISKFKSEMFSDKNPSFKKEFSENAKQLRAALYSLAKLKERMNRLESQKR